MEFSATEFTPWAALLGGGLIGLASVLLLLLTGRIAGISGIAAGLLAFNRKEAGWRLAFILGLIGGAALYPMVSGEPLGVELQVGWPLMAGAGFLVGFGTRMASGCTAGHGISGLARLSRRSLAAVATFFCTALITVYVVRNLI
ncbi:MAG: YeeE/YedE thiosulfate transporter family protein [Anaerolineae bacterium]|nr:YeeE/YedE thiosulfate transporter family protein [Anaerolineae bacterium]